MKDIIVIGTSPGREFWVSDILSSISRPAIVVSDFGFELGKIRWVFENTNCERFLFLQDSVVIRDESLFDLLFESPGSSCIMCEPTCYGSYMGVYERKILSKLGIPIVTTKEESIIQEITWTKKYVQSCNELNHPVTITHQKFKSIRKNGRENLVYLNEYYEKWKGDWGDPIGDYIETLHDIERVRVEQQMLEKSRRVMDLSREKSALQKLLKANLRNHKILIQSLQKDYSKATLQLELISNSFSWKLLSPLRKLLSFMNYRRK